MHVLLENRRILKPIRLESWAEYESEGKNSLPCTSNGLSSEKLKKTNFPNCYWSHVGKLRPLTRRDKYFPDVLVVVFGMHRNG